MRVPDISDFEEVGNTVHDFSVVMALCEVIDEQRFKGAALHEEFANRLQRSVTKHKALANKLKSEGKL